MDSKKYSAVPPPASLSSGGATAAPIDFNNALSKARAIAEKLKQQSSGGETFSPVAAAATATTAPYSSGNKRGYEDDNSSSRSYGNYQDGHDSKRSAYGSGSSRPSYGNEYRRHGLGSEERHSHGQQQHGYGNSTNREEYSVPNHMVGLLIGKGGENLKKIERTSGVSKVQFANDPVGDERKVYLDGEPDQISIARDMIIQMVADARDNESGRGGSGGFRGNQQGGGNTVSIKVPTSKVGLVIGPGGKTIRDFEERSKARIRVVSEDGGDAEKTINLIGDDSSVQHAKSLIEDLVYGGNNSGFGGREWNQQPYGNGAGGRGGGGGGYDQQYQQQPPNSSYGVGHMGRNDDERVFVTVPASSVGLIIGRGGETVRALQEQSGARVKVEPPSDDNSEERTVSISGDPKCVAIAKQLVEDKAAEASNGRGGGRGGGGGGGYNNDGYNRGGYRSRNNDYGNDNNQRSNYQSGDAGGGYDYSQQHGQQYGQYGYDQSQYNSGYQQYPGYQYGYGDNNNEQQQQIPGNETAQSGDSSTTAPPPPSSNSDSKEKTDTDDGNGASAYNAHYNGGQQYTPEQQQAYYQWYQQQYYGQQQYGSYDQPTDSGKQNESTPNPSDEKSRENSPTPPPPATNTATAASATTEDDVDGEPLNDEKEHATN